MTLLELPFMQRALLAALVTGLAAPAVGTYLVQRRLALMGDGIGHVALTGVAVGLLANATAGVPDVPPTLTAVAVAILGAVTIELVRARGRASGDVALAMLFYGGIAGGVVLTGLAGGSAATLNSFLFGSLTTVSWTDLMAVVALSSVVLLVALGLAPRLFAVCQDEEYARVAGIHVRAYGVLLAVLAAVTVTLAMRTVGLLLVSALMVVPVATAQQLTRSFRATLLLSLGLGVTASLVGVVGSFYADVAPGATIVLVALAGFAVTWPVGAALTRRRVHAAGRALPADELAVSVPHVAAEQEHADEHPHEHGEACGHRALPHDDHVDYVHDGHLHARHGSHYDEH